jgi:hypothetical protein
MTALTGMSALLPYSGITLAAIVEGEIAYIGAATWSPKDGCIPSPCWSPGALGAAIGDQTLFLRVPRLRAAVARPYPSLQQKVSPLITRCADTTR